MDPRFAAPGARAAAAAKRARDCACRKPLGAGWDPDVRRALDALAADVASHRGEARAERLAPLLAEADVAAANASRVGYSLEIQRLGEPLVLLLYRAGARAVLEIRHDETGLTRWDLTTSDAGLAAALLRWAPSWVVVATPTARRDRKTNKHPPQWERTIAMRLRPKTS